ncbi:MAG: LysR family transcriptional regulator [Verrucomicrobiales bacterium]|nr:LysR family transcriptional regulator [Verrucomicrobiota bacterium JB025]
MEIRLLKTFVAVARTKGFSAAARELNTVQPAVSRQISDLEAELGVSLFWRNSREVKITVAGETLLREAVAILAHEERARDLVQRAASGQTGHLRIGYISAASMPFLPAIIRHYRTRFPDVRISMTEMNAQQQLDAFDNDRIDIGISRHLPTPRHADLRYEPLYSDHLAAFVPADHPLAGQPHVNLTQLEPHPHILFERSGAVELFDQIISACRNAGFSPRITRQPENMQSVLTEVASGLGVSIAPGCIRHLNMTGCRSIPIQPPLAPIPCEIHYRNEPREPMVSAFANLAKNSTSDIQHRMNHLP